MALVDMKRPKIKKSDMKDVVAGYPGEGDRYPWGLQLRLEREELERLGLDAKDFKIDANVSITASGSVTGIEMRESTGGKQEYQTVSIQIEKLDLGMRASKFAGFNNQNKKGPGE